LGQNNGKLGQNNGKLGQNNGKLGQIPPKKVLFIYVLFVLWYLK